MLVSAVSADYNRAYISKGKYGSMGLYAGNNGGKNGDTIFNSSISGGRMVSKEDLPQMFEHIVEWQDFCHKQILGGQIDITV